MTFAFASSKSATCSLPSSLRSRVNNTGCNSMSNILPNELVDIIFSLLESPSDQLQLVKVGRQFNTVGRPHIWRHLHAHIPVLVTLRRVKTTLSKDAALAQSVRSFDIPFLLARPESSDFQLQRIPTLMKILVRLTALRTLIIDLGDKIETGCEGNFASFPVFPQLQHLMVPSSLAFLYFALRHSTLVALHLGEVAFKFMDLHGRHEDIDTSQHQPLEYLNVQGPFALHQHLVLDQMQPIEEGIELYRPIASTCIIRIDSPAWLDPEANLIVSLEKHESLTSCSLHLPNADLFDVEAFHTVFKATKQTSPGSTKKVRSLRMGFVDVVSTNSCSTLGVLPENFCCRTTTHTALL